MRPTCQPRILNKNQIYNLNTKQIQISHADVIRPIRNLCYRDEAFARTMTVELVSSLAKEMDQASAKNLMMSLVGIINQVNQLTSVSSFWIREAIGHFKFGILNKYNINESLLYKF